MLQPHINYYGYIINNDPLIYRKRFELSFKAPESQAFSKLLLPLMIEVTLRFIDELSAQAREDLRLCYNLGLAINGCEKFLEIVNEDLRIVDNLVCFSCSFSGLLELIGSLPPVYNA